MSIVTRIRRVALTLSAALLFVLVGSCDTAECGDCTFSGTEISVLIAYLDAAAIESGGIGPYLEQVVDETNAVFENSRIDVRLAVVGTMSVSYELTERLVDLRRLLDPADGFLDEIHVERDRLMADVAILVTNRPSSTTNASIMATPETAFVIVNRVDMGAPGFAFAHEVGHLLGARHSVDRDPEVVPFQYGHGFRNDSLRTVVANGSQRVVPYFSSPSISYQGVVLGDSTYADVARVISETAVFVSNFRGPLTPTGFTTPGTWPVLP